ncbi:hypothetical protein AKO1_014667 [Acrasis kona]|uniref:EF-hand domain-containing protein n=1 Tax=Acrasis kona TaxID=1008807 RepID=A0AAW2Z0Q9_9EUKA
MSTEQEVWAKQLRKKEKNASRDSLEIAKAVFNQFDANKDGKLDVQEMRTMLAFLDEGISVEEAEDMIRHAGKTVITTTTLKIDFDEDGLISFDEFKNQVL